MSETIRLQHESALDEFGERLGNFYREWKFVVLAVLIVLVIAVIWEGVALHSAMNAAKKSTEPFINQSLMALQASDQADLQRENLAMTRRQAEAACNATTARMGKDAEWAWLYNQVKSADTDASAPVVFTEEKMSGRPDAADLTRIMNGY